MVSKGQLRACAGFETVRKSVPNRWISMSRQNAHLSHVVILFCFDLVSLTFDIKTFTDF